MKIDEIKKIADLLEIDTIEEESQDKNVSTLEVVLFDCWGDDKSKIIYFNTETREILDNYADIMEIKAQIFVLEEKLKKLEKKD